MNPNPNSTDLPNDSLVTNEGVTQSFTSSTADNLQAAFDRTNGVNSESGYPSRELGIDPTIKAPGSHQFLRGNAHDDDPTKIWVDGSDVVQEGQMLQINSAPVGAPTQVNPAGDPEDSLIP